MQYDENENKTENLQTNNKTYKKFKVLLPFVLVFVMLFSTIALSIDNRNSNGQLNADGYTLGSHEGMAGGLGENYTHSSLFASMIFSKSKGAGTADDVNLTIGEILNTNAMVEENDPSNVIQYGQIPVGDNSYNGGQGVQDPGAQRLVALLRTYYTYGYLVQVDRSSSTMNFATDTLDSLFGNKGIYGKTQNAIMSTTSVGTFLYGIGISIVDTLFKAVQTFNPIAMLGFAKEMALTGNTVTSKAVGWLNDSISNMLSIIGLDLSFLNALRNLWIIVFLMISFSVIGFLVWRNKLTADNRGAIGKGRIMFTKLLVMILSIPLMWYSALVIDELADGFRDNSKLAVNESVNSVILDTLDFASKTNMQLPLESLEVEGEGNDLIIKGAKPTNEFMDNIQSNIGGGSSDPIETIEGFNSKQLVNVSDYIGAISSEPETSDIAARDNSIYQFDGKSFYIGGYSKEAAYPYTGHANTNDSGQIVYNSNEPVYFMSENPSVKQEFIQKMGVNELITKSTAFKQVYFGITDVPLEGEGDEEQAQTVFGKVSKSIMNTITENPKDYRIINDSYKLSSLNPTVLNRVAWNRPETYIYGVIPAGSTSKQHKDISNFVHNSGSFQRNNPFNAKPFIDVDGEIELNSQGSGFEAYKDAINKGATENHKVGPYKVSGNTIENVQKIMSGEEDIDGGSVEMNEEEFPKAVANMNRNSLYVAMANKYSGISQRNGYAPTLSTQSVTFLLQTTYNGKGTFKYRGYDTIASDAGSTKNKGMNGIAFYRYVIPHSSKMDLVTKTMSMGLKWIVTGIASILAAWYLVRSPLVPAILNQFGMIFKGFLKGDIVAVLGFALYYGAMKFAFALAYILIGLVSGISSMITNLFDTIITNNLTEGFLSGVIAGTDAVGNIPFAGDALHGFISSSSMLLGVILAIFVLVILTWPFFEMPNRRGKVRKYSLMETAIAFLFIYADEVYKNLEHKYSVALNGKGSGSTFKQAKQSNGMKALNQRKVAGDRMKKGRNVIATGAFMAATGGAGTAAALKATKATKAMGALKGIGGTVKSQGLRKGATEAMKLAGNNLSGGAKKALNAYKPGGAPKNASGEEIGFNDYAAMSYNNAGLDDPDSSFKKDKKSVKDNERENPELQDGTKKDSNAEQQNIENSEIKNANVEQQDTEKSDVDKQETEQQDTQQQDTEQQDVEKEDDDKALDNVNMGIHANEIETDKLRVKDQDVENADTDMSNIEDEDVEKSEIEDGEVHNQDTEQQDLEQSDVENQDTEQSDVEQQDTQQSDVDTQETEQQDNNNDKENDMYVEDMLVENQDSENSNVGIQDTELSDVQEQHTEKSDVEQQDTEQSDVDTQETGEENESNVGNLNVNEQRVGKQSSEQGIIDNQNVKDQQSDNQNVKDQQSDNQNVKEPKEVQNIKAKELVSDKHGIKYSNIDELKHRNNPEVREKGQRLMFNEGDPNSTISKSFRKFDQQLDELSSTIGKHESRIENNMKLQQDLEKKLHSGQISREKFNKEYGKLEKQNGKDADSIKKLVDRMDKVSDKQKITVDVGSAIQNTSNIPGFDKFNNSMDKFIDRVSGDKGAYIKEQRERRDRISGATPMSSSTLNSKSNNVSSKDNALEKAINNLSERLERQQSDNQRQIREERRRHNDTMIQNRRIQDELRRYNSRNK